MTQYRLKTWLLVVLFLPLSALAFELEAVSDDAQLSQALQKLESEPQTPQARAWLVKLLSHQETSRRPHPEHPDLDLPRYAIAARAQSLLLRWQQQSAFERMQQQPKSHAKSPLFGPELKARVAWIAQASNEQLGLFRDSRLGQPFKEEISLALARRQAQAGEQLDLARHGKSSAALNYLSEVISKAEDTHSLALLQAMRNNSHYSGAVAKIHAAWLQQHPQNLAVFQQTWRQQALSAEQLELALLLRPPQLLNKLSESLYSSDDAALAAWGLWQLQSPQALAILQAYLVSEEAKPELAQELQQWLR